MPVSSVFDTHSPQAGAISRLFLLSLGISAIIFLLVVGLVLYAIVRYRGQPGQEDPTPVFGMRHLEIAWTIAPAVILLGMFGLTVTTMRATNPPAAKEADIVITGYQWWWDVRYPQAHVVTANEIHIPVGKQLRIELKGGDVIHDFWVPQLARKMDMVPGHTNELLLFADTPGTYLGACAEYCGTQHAWMRIQVIAQSQAEFDSWQQAQARGAAVTADAAANQGAQRFRQLTCSSCHAIGGTGANAQVGPDLTHIASRNTLGAGIIENTPDNLARWIANPHAIKQGVLMPNLQLSDADVRALVAYMEALK
ncbi:MAG: cytochrome c oxidase subunit II [Herpetosiphonaceae bacterium]|nr:cytochrome c oxidase subunit II [Herpetosiphonaceae bacterium]